MTDILAVIPSRGGSVELRRKNLLPIDGVPMFLRSARAARDAVWKQGSTCQVVVSTDDPEIRSTAIVAGFDVHDRGEDLADVPVDEVVKDAVASVKCPACSGLGIEPWSDVWNTDENRPCHACDGEGLWGGPVLLVQPTVQPITAEALTRFLRQVSKTNLYTATAVVPVTDQLWRDHWITQRVNRQDRTDMVYKELGIRLWSMARHVGVVDEMVTISMAPHELVDIDTVNDYRSVTPKRNIVFWPIADKEHGQGHLRRCLAIAERLQHHNITFITNDLDTVALNLINSRGWQTSTAAEISDPALSVLPDADLWVLDKLDTDTTDVTILSGRVVSLEDHGPGNQLTAVTINALYDTTGANIKSGVDWCVLRPEFTSGEYTVTEETRALNVMVMFGGTDPSGLGERIHRLFPNQSVDWIKSGDDRSISEAMHDADILITSAGRTVFEAAAVGIPTIVLAQNLRETTHTHIGYGAGNIYLGLGRMVSDTTIMDTVRDLEGDYDLRVELSQRGRPDGKGLDRILHTIEGLLEGL